MTELRVVAVEYGALATTRGHVYLNHGDYHEADGPFAIAYYFWLILGGERPVVVDTGFSSEGGARRGRTTLIDPPDALAALGIGPEDEVTVVLTHAHYDHIGNIDYFQRGRFVMAAAEYDFATSADADHVLFRAVADESGLEQLRRLRADGRLDLITTETELAPGVRLLIAPGHTPGQLMVDVEGAGVLLTSDAVHFDEELDRDMPFRNMTDLPDAYRSFARIRGLRDGGRLIVAGHEPSVAIDHPAVAGLGFTAVEIRGTGSR